MRSLVMEPGVAYEFWFVASASVLAYELLVRGVGLGACWGEAALGVGEDVLAVVDGGVERVVLAGAAEVAWPVPADGFSARRSLTSRAVTKIPMPIRATMATPAARPRRRGGWAGC